MAGYHVQARGLAVGYDGRPLIRDIDIDIARGEIVSLIGPNGAGKSTILKSISRQLLPLAGTVYLNGDDLARMPRRDLAARMAVVLTDRPSPELMTCRDVAAAGRYPHTGRLGRLADADREAVEAALRTMHALDYADRDFTAVSDGQRQRVLIARALCQEPEVLVLDEPTSYLDVHHKLALMGVLRALAKERGVTVILSLHEIDLAQKVSDRILCVRGETVERWGTPEEVFREEGIRALYGIEQGAYDPLFGSVELPRPEGEAGVFVVCGCGTGIPVFRRLQREGVPFRAGILYTNDVDCRVARALAAEVVEEEPFHEIGDAALARALACVRGAKRVIDAGAPVGPVNRRVRQVLDEAARLGKLEKERQP